MVVDEALMWVHTTNEMASLTPPLSPDSCTVRKELSTCPLYEILFDPFPSVDNERLSDL